MLFRAFSKEARLARTLARRFGSILSHEGGKVPKFYESVQFSKDRLTDFQELPRGQVPHALTFSPAHSHTRLANGVQFFTEQYGGEFATVSAFVKAGSRFETIQSSGASHFLTYMLAKGSKLKNRKEFQKALDALGAHVEVTTGREIIGFSLKVNSADVGAAIALLSEAISSPDFNENQVEADKEFVHRRILDVSRDQFEYTKEALFYTSFRDHMVGQSEYGIRDNIPSLTARELEDFHRLNFTGPNTVFVVTGKFDQAQALQAVQGGSQALPAQAEEAQENLEKPWLTPVVMAQRDDEMYNLNSGSAFSAPAFGDKDFFALKFLEKVVGDFNAEKDGQAHLNSAHMSMNMSHQLWGSKLGVTLAHTKYEAFSDFGVFTLFAHGNDMWAQELFLGTNYLASSMGKILEITQVFRARAEWFNELLAQHASKKLNEDIARELFYVGRRITRTEWAFRLSHLADPCALKKIAKEHLFDKEVGFVLWGPQHNIANYNYYCKKLHISTKADPWTVSG